MIVAIAAGAGPNWTFPPNFFVGAETMTGHIARISGGDLSYASVDYTSIFVIGMTLFIITFLLTQASTMITTRFREQYE
jgi:phosphate transport system permease protein